MPNEYPTQQQIINQVYADLRYEFELQKIRRFNLYTNRSAVIAPQARVPEEIDIAGDGDFKSEWLYVVIDKEFSDDEYTILCQITDGGSQNLITREAIDLRAIASPGIFAPNSANVGNANFARGIPFPYLFPAKAPIQIDYTSTEPDQANDHRVTLVFAGVTVQNWGRLEPRA
jgi:hypothetical protein